MICVVTDRRHADVVEQARRAADAGVDLFQIRERDLDAKPLADLLAAVQRVTRGSSIRVVVNDRLDVALAHSADGVHLRGDSIPVADARRLASPPFLVGRSVHSAGEAAASHGADYLIAGAVFPTASKPSDTRWLGLDGLRSIVSASRAPVLAIGGVTLDRLPELAAAGAAGFAAISLFTAGDFTGIVKRARSVFDSLKTRP